MAQIGTRNMKIEVDGNEYTPEVSNARFAAADGDSDFLSFADAAAGGNKDYTFNFTAAQDLATGSLWRIMFDNAGDEVVVTLMPYGNAVPSATEPHVTSTVTVGAPDGDFLGGEANTSKSAKMTWDGAWEATKPTLVTTAP